MSGGWGENRGAVAGGILGGLLLFACASLAHASVMWLPFERIYESTDIVCIADAIEVIPAPEPTPEIPTTELTNRLRVVQIWKGDPPDTLVLRGLTGRKYDPQGRTVVWGQACPEPKRLIAGNRYLVIASSRPPGELPDG